MTAMTDLSTLAIVDKASELNRCVTTVETVTDLPYAGGTVTVGASDKTAAESRANTLRADLKTLVDGESDYS